MASLANGQVNEYSPSGALVQTLIPNANVPTGSAFDGAGNLYVTEFAGNDILKVDGATGAVSVFSSNAILGDGTTFDSPESIAFGPGYTRMYVSDANRFGSNGGIHVIDTATGKGVGFLPLPSSSGSEGTGESDWLAFSQSATLYMTNESPTQGVMQVDQATGDIQQPSFVPNLPDIGYAMSFDRNGDLWLSDTSKILEYGPTGTLLRTITNPSFSTVFSAVFDPPFDTIYAGDLSNGNIYTYDLSGNLTNTFSVGSGVDGLSVAGTVIVPSAGWRELMSNRTVSSKSFGHVAGRVDALAVDPNTSQTVFAGTAGGGVWRSDNQGATWTPLSDNATSLAVGALALDPNDPNTLFVGTGDNWLGYGSLPGVGIMVTHDAHDSSPIWSVIQGSRGTFAGKRITGIVVDRSNSSRLLVSAEDGIWLSEDTGSTWTRVIGSGTTLFSDGAVGWAVAQNLDHPNTFLATAGETARCQGAAFVSHDSGRSWVQSSTVKGRGNPTNGKDNVMRLSLAVGPNDVAYTMATDCRDGGYFNGGRVTRSSNSGNPGWAGTADPPFDLFAPDPTHPNKLIGEGGYVDVGVVNPKDAGDAIFGGVWLLHLTREGTSFHINNRRDWETWVDPDHQYVHPDIHALAFASDGTLFVGSDGGVWTATVTDRKLNGTGAGAWHERNTGLGALQFYRGDGLGLNTVAGGAQDNGDIAVVQGSANALDDNIDGSATALTADGRAYFEDDGSVQRASLSAAGTFGSFTNISCQQQNACRKDTAAGINTPFLLNSLDQSQLLFATDRLFAKSDPLVGPPSQWTVVSPTLPPPSSSLHSDCVRLDTFKSVPDGDCFTALAVGAAPTTVVLGSDLGTLWFHQGPFNGASGTGWRQINGNLPAVTSSTKLGWLPWITGVAWSHTNDDEGWVTLGVAGQTAKVWHTSNATSINHSWAPSGDATNGIPADAIVFGVTNSPTDAATVYLATSIGVFVCTSCGGNNFNPSWHPLGSGLPNVAVWSVSLTHDNKALLAWTFGRGVWEFTL